MFGPYFEQEQPEIVVGQIWEDVIQASGQRAHCKSCKGYYVKVTKMSGTIVHYECCSSNCTDHDQLTEADFRESFIFWTEPFEEAKAIFSEKKCNCDLVLLMNQGCQCGGK